MNELIQDGIMAGLARIHGPNVEAEIEILGEMRPARLITKVLFDPDGARLRG